MTMSLDELRDRIDAINEEIVDDVAERMEVVRQIGELKDDTDRSVRDPEREAVVKDQFAELFAEQELPKEHGRELADVLIRMAVEVQRR